MIPNPFLLSATSSGITRMRGGDPEIDQLVKLLDIVLPACAGVIPTLERWFYPARSITRMRGGDPIGRS